MKTVAALFLIFLSPLPAAASASGTAPMIQLEKMSAVRKEMNDAINKVAKIVNQPVVHLPLNPAVSPAIFSPGWFHPGAITPEFTTVDIRKTQEFPYAGKPYVSSDLNPTEMFLGAELEFNAMTKYFYTDRTLPKKKLTEQEMVEINRLYRVIGKCQKELSGLQTLSPEASFSAQGLLHSSVSVLIPLALFAGAIAWVFLFRKRA